MVIDGSNRANNKDWQDAGAYLPWVIHKKVIRRFCPLWALKRLTYFYDEGKEEGEEEKEKEKQGVIDTQIINRPEVLKKQEVNRLLDHLILSSLIFMLADGIILFILCLNYFNIITMNTITVIDLVLLGGIILFTTFIFSFLGYKKLKLEFK